MHEVEKGSYWSLMFVVARVKMAGKSQSKIQEEGIYVKIECEPSPVQPTIILPVMLMTQVQNDHLNGLKPMIQTCSSHSSLAD